MIAPSTVSGATGIETISSVWYLDLWFPKTGHGKSEDTLQYRCVNASPDSHNLVVFTFIVRLTAFRGADDYPSIHEILNPVIRNGRP